MKRTVKTIEFLKSETLHDAVVLESIWEGVRSSKSNRLVVNVRFYVDYPGIERRSFLSIVFENAVVDEVPWPEFDMYDFENVCDSPLTFVTIDCATGKTLPIQCSDSHIVLDDTFFEYLTKFERPLLTAVHQVTD